MTEHGLFPNRTVSYGNGTKHCYSQRYDESGDDARFKKDSNRFTHLCHSLYGLRGLLGIQQGVSQ